MKLTISGCGGDKRINFERRRKFRLSRNRIIQTLARLIKKIPVPPYYAMILMENEGDTRRQEYLHKKDISHPVDQDCIFRISEMRINLLMEVRLSRRRRKDGRIAKAIAVRGKSH